KDDDESADYYGVGFSGNAGTWGQRSVLPRGHAASRHKLKMRLTTPQVAVDAGEDGEPRDIVRRKTLIYFPALGALAPKLEFFLQQAAVKMPVSTFLSIAAGAVFVTALVTFVMYMPLPAVLGLTAVAGVIPFWVVSFKRKRRFSAFQEQFPDAIDM